ncbi:MAG TPA: hypothetical protein VHK24_06560, partial [Steroidobacter sp.]|nr:hypothetical protein [Steroidobacter sp.]
VPRVTSPTDHRRMQTRLNSPKSPANACSSLSPAYTNRTHPLEGPVLRRRAVSSGPEVALASATAGE